MASPARVSAAGIAELMSHEAIVPFRYRDSVGVDTFGVGHTSAAGAPDPKAMSFADERPLAEVITVFRRDLRRFEARVGRAVTVPLAAHEFDALVSFDFNTGGIHRAKLTEALNSGDRTAAAAGFMGWVKPPEIRARREKEQALFAAGAYVSGGRASVIPADDRGRVLYAQAKRIDVTRAIAGIEAANAADRRAERAGRGAAGSGVAAGGSGVGSQAAPADTPHPAPAAPPSPSRGEGLSPESPPPDSLAPDGLLPLDWLAPDTLLLVAAAVLAGVALGFAFAWLRARREARARNAEAADAIRAELVNPKGD